ncbi:unnamed protein product [Ectocarpus sp. CCAP 1310/34]|nr:unnamed protein product [Ectocarpus sp. CCAP 1310/34]
MTVLGDQSNYKLARYCNAAVDSLRTRQRQVVNRTAVKLSLASFGGGWMPRGETGNLRVRAINTGGGMYAMDEGVSPSGWAFLCHFVSTQKTNKSKVKLTTEVVMISVVIMWFPTDKEAHLEFGFGGPKEGTFSCSILSETRLAVKLEGDSKWAQQGGSLYLLKAKFGEAEGDEEEVDYTSPGLKVATILDDPSVSESHLHVYASHTKHITIQGIGFLSTFNFHVKPKASGVVIAEVRKDDATFNCEDSCVYANDGQCDEIRVTSSVAYLGSSSMLGGDSDDVILADAPSCPLGTDCTDCGLELAEDGKCTNTCRFARDGVCDDRRAVGLCADGTDCQDCGPWGQSNFTEASGGGGERVWESPTSLSEAYDDDGFLANDPNHPILDGQAGNGIGRFKRVFVKHNSIRKVGCLFLYAPESDQSRIFDWPSHVLLFTHDKK